MQEDNPHQVTVPVQAAMGPAVTLAWSKSGETTHHLCIGKLYVGSVYRLVAPNWRETNTMKETSPHFLHNERYEDTPWRAWFMHDEDGDAIGFFETADEAKNHLAEYAVRSLTAGPGPGTVGGPLEDDLTSTSELSRLRTALEKHDAFVRDLCSEGFPGDIDGAELQDMLVKHGLYQIEPFDPAKHNDESGAAEPGDDFYVPTNIAREAPLRPALEGEKTK